MYRLWERGETQAAVARQVGVVAQTMARWVSQYQHEGKSGLKKAGRAGRKPELDQQDRERLQMLLVEGPEQLGYETPLWTCPRVAHLIEREFGVRYHPGHVWKLLMALGWSPQRPTGRARERNQADTLRWKRKVRPAIKKSHTQGRVIVLVDESGLSQRPHRVCTWAPRGVGGRFPRVAHGQGPFPVLYAGI